MSQLSHAQFPLRRHPNLLVDHRRSRSAAVAEPRGANGEAVTGSGGRLHFGMVAGIKSERWPTSNRNPWPDCLGIRKIGVDKGGSLVMWRRCFPNARVTGVDIRDVPCVPGCQVFQGDSRNSDWVRTAFPPASIDVVIDDGDHSLESQIATF